MVSELYPGRKPSGEATFARKRAKSIIFSDKMRILGLIEPRVEETSDFFALWAIFSVDYLRF